MDYWELIGWTGALVFVLSLTLQNRRMLHSVGLIGAIIKLIYSAHYGLMPLIANWILVIGIEIYVLIRMLNQPKEANQ